MIMKNWRLLPESHLFPPFFQVSAFKFHPSSSPSLTPRLHRRDIDKIFRKGVGREGFGSHLNEADKGAAEVRDVSTAPINDRSGSHNNTTVRPDNVDGLLNPAPAGDNVLSNEKTLSRGDLKAAQDKTSIPILLHKDMTGAEMTGDFLADDNATYGRGDDSRHPSIHLRVVRAEFIGQFTTDASGDGRILKEKCALEKLPAVQTGAEDEMTVQQGSGLFEEG